MKKYERKQGEIKEKRMKFRNCDEIFTSNFFVNKLFLAHEAHTRWRLVCFEKNFDR